MPVNPSTGLTSDQDRVLRGRMIGVLAVLAFGILLIFVGVALFTPIAAWDALVGFLVLTIGGLAMLIAAGNEARKVGKFRRRAHAALHPDILTADGDLRLDATGPSESLANPPEAATVGESRRPCPFCGTWNVSEYTYCQSCGKKLPAR